MIKIKILNNIKKLHLKIFGSFPKIVLSNNQEKEIIPTKETQEIIPDKEYDGLSKVIIKPIPDEYIIPSGNIEISQNGTYDVTDKASANVNVQPNLQEKTQTITENGTTIFEPDTNYDGLSRVEVNVNTPVPAGTLDITENGNYNVKEKEFANVNVPTKTLGTKTITANGTYLATDDNLDGYSEVEVATSGVDINDYFKSETIDPNPTSVGCWYKFIKKIPKLNLNITNNCSNMFYYCKAEEIDVSEFNTSNVTNMYQMFFDCSSLTILDLSSFDTSKVKNMRNMFQSCSSLTILDLSSFDTSNVTDMSNMFNGCSKLTNLDLSNFNTAKVTNMSNMFNGCSKLTNLDLSNFNTSNVTNMNNMFARCYLLTELDLSNFDTSSVTNMSAMFYTCINLNNLNISNFDFSKVTSYSNMFQSVPANCYILVKDATAKEWITSKFTTLTNVHYVGEE